MSLLTFLLSALARLPLRVLYLLSDGTGFLLYHLVRYRRRLVRRNLTRAYPTKTKKEIKRIERKFYRFFCDYVVETIHLLRISEDEVRRRFLYTNTDLIERLSEDGKPFFVFLGHYGNWEYFASFPLWTPERITVCHVYHPLSNKAMDRLMIRLRDRFGSIGMPQNETYRTLVHLKDAGRQPLVGLIADQRPLMKHHTVWMDFLRQPTALITGSERIGVRMDAHFLYGEVKVVRRGYYTITYKEIFPDENEDFSLTKQYMHQLEQTIDSAPQYYLWSHNRWKYRPDAEGHPVLNA